MGDEASKLSASVGLDTTDYKTAVSGLNREMRVVESGFKASAAALGDWGKDATGLEMRIESLNKTTDLQRQKVDATRREYERVREEKGDNARAAQELEIKLNKETETLNKMERELGETEKALEEVRSESDEAGKEVQDLGRKSDVASDSLGGLKKVAGGLKDALKIGVAAVAGLAAAVAGVSAAVGKLVLDSASASADLIDLSAKVGLSTDTLQELAYVGDQVGTSADTMTGSLVKMTRTMGDARDEARDYQRKLRDAEAAGKDLSEIELGDYAKAYDTLGVAVVDANGNLRDQETVFRELITALGQVDNATERDALALDIFGRSAMELNPLIKAGANEIARLSQEAHDVGAVVEEDTVAALEEFDDKVVSLKASISGTAKTLAGAFLPGFSTIIDGARGYASKLANIVKESDGDFGQMATGIAGLAGEMAADIAEQAPRFLETGLNILQGIIGGLTANLPMMLPAVVSIVGTLVQFIVQNLPILMDAGVQIIFALLNGILPALPAILTAGIQAIVTLAQGIAQALPQLIPTAVETIIALVMALVDNLPLILDAALQLVLGLTEGILAALPLLIAMAPQLIGALCDALVLMLPLLLTAGIQLVFALVNGILSSLPSMGESAGELINVLVENFMKLFPMIKDLGVRLVEGIWQGMQNSYANFEANVRGFFTGIVDGVKRLLGIQSPSKVFAGIGENMVAGMGTGFLDGFGEVERKIAGAVNKLSGDASVNVGLASGKAFQQGSGQKIFQIEAINIRINATGSKAEAAAIGRSAEQGVLRALRAAGAA